MSPKKTPISKQKKMENTRTYVSSQKVMKDGSRLSKRQAPATYQKTSTKNLDLILTKLQIIQMEILLLFLAIPVLIYAIYCLTILNQHMALPNTMLQEPSSIQIGKKERSN